MSCNPVGAEKKSRNGVSLTGDQVWKRDQSLYLGNPDGRTGQNYMPGKKGGDTFPGLMRKEHRGSIAIAGNRARGRRHPLGTQGSVLTKGATYQKYVITAGVKAINGRGLE